MRQQIRTAKTKIHTIAEVDAEQRASESTDGTEVRVALGRFGRFRSEITTQQVRTVFSVRTVKNFPAGNTSLANVSTEASKTHILPYRSLSRVAHQSTQIGVSFV